MAIEEKDLRTIPLFKDADAKLLRDIASAGRIRHCRKGTLVFDEGGPGDYVFIVKSGLAKVTLFGKKGQEVILAFIAPGEMVGELAILDSERRSATILTLEETEFYEIPQGSFLGAVRENAKFANKLIEHLVAVIRRTTDQLRTKCMYESERQVLHRLFINSEHERTKDGALILRKCPQIQQIAQMIGCSRETPGRRLRDLEKAGFIKTRRKPGGGVIDITIKEKAVNFYLKDVLDRATSQGSR